MSEAVPSSFRAKATLLAAGVLSLALGTYELRAGLPQNTLGLVADAWHNFGDGPIYMLRGAAMHIEGRGSRRLRKAAAGVMLVGSLVTAYETADVALSTPPSEYLESESRPLTPLALAMVGNAAITGLVLSERKNKTKISEEARDHALLDTKHSFFRLGAAATRLPIIDMLASGYYGVVESARLGVRMLKSSGHHDHHGHSH